MGDNNRGFCQRGRRMPRNWRKERDTFFKWGRRRVPHCKTGLGIGSLRNKDFYEGKEKENTKEEKKDYLRD